MPDLVWTRPKRGTEAAKKHGFMDTYFPSKTTSKKGGKSSGSGGKYKCPCPCHGTSEGKGKEAQSAMYLPDTPRSDSSKSKQEAFMIESHEQCRGSTIEDYVGGGQSSSKRSSKYDDAFSDQGSQK